jgi:outer membrane receptor protein involved in Fe transport
MRLSILLCVAVLCLLFPQGVHALELGKVRFVVVDAVSRQPLARASVTVEDLNGAHAPCALAVGETPKGQTPVFDLRRWAVASGGKGASPTVITLSVGAAITLRGQAAPVPTPQGQPPVKDIYIKVTARLIPQHANPIAPGTTFTQKEINSKAGVGGNLNKVIEGTSGVASDSAGQQHVRGEHADISYVVDGVPLPDTLSGRQGSVVVPSTIERLEILTGGFAPEFGGQTAAVLNVTTLPGVHKASSDIAFAGGDYETTNGDYTALGPIGKYASYVLDLGATRTNNYIEPQQPDDQTAHNTGSSQNYFTKLRYTPSHNDTLTLTLSSNPDTFQDSNRTGLPASFAAAGEGYGFLGLRNANGVRPDVTPETAGLLGAQTLMLPSQQTEGQNINTREASEFATLSWRRQLSHNASGQLAFTFLHAGQDLHNGNPAVDVLNLPVDNSIEYNPTSTRNVHHVQITGGLASTWGRHEFKTGLVLDDQEGDETYNIVPASQLALDEIAALSPSLAPPGTVQRDAHGNAVLDIDGNPVYKATGQSPTLRVHRAGFYRAAYAQDTWRASHRFTINYGLRTDWYKQAQDLGQPIVDVITLSPRLNFSYTLDRLTTLRWSYDRLFNTPPLAQGAVVGEPIQPEILDQYDVSMEHQLAPGQTLSLAYYIKQIHNQVDTGLLVPGSQIGLYSAVNFQIGAVHGFELAYDLTPRKSFGLNASLNYTYSIAAPNGLDNTGAPAPQYNDHDQRDTIGAEMGYTWKSGASASLVFNYGSGLASSPIPPSTDRIPRTRLDLHFSTGPRVFHGHGGIGLDVENVFDDRTVINFESGFSGTRFQQGRRILFNLFAHF